MKKTIVLILTLILTLSLTEFSAFAQSRMPVEVQVRNTTDDTPIVGATVYATNTVAEGQDVQNALKKLIDTGEWTDFSAAEYGTDEGGYVTVTVMETGALVVFVEGNDSPQLIKVNYRSNITVNFDMAVVLDEATVSVEQEGMQAESEVEIVGNYLNISSAFTIPANLGKPNARLIIMPFVLAANKVDTVQYRPPIVMDGSEYHMTQLRRMGYDETADPLFAYVRDTLSSKAQKVQWVDSIYLEDLNKLYYVNYIAIMEDYNMVYFTHEEFLKNTGRIRRPLKFLDYNTTPYILDPIKYKKEPRIEQLDDKAELSLNFLPGKAQLAEDDTASWNGLKAAKARLMEIINGEGSKLKELYISGVASPDGTYEKNRVLAKERLRFAANEIYYALPKHARDRMIYNGDNSTVAEWNVIVDSLRKDSLASYADQVQDIIDKFPNSRDKQWTSIRNLSFYRSNIVPYFEKLRSVQYSYSYEERRSLSPEEILDRYENDQAYRSGKKSFHLYEYWHLFNMVEDEKELENLYRRAYRDSRRYEGKYWELAANNLAVSLMNRGVVDTTILAPFIDITVHKCDAKFTKQIGVRKFTEIVNPKEIVANQLIMYLKDNNFRSASILAKILPEEEEFEMLKAFTLCLGGYYKGGNTTEERQRRQEVFEKVCESSTKNKVIMLLARKLPQYNREALQVVEELSKDDALTYYLKTIALCRKAASYTLLDYADADLAAECLTDCFIKDKSYMEIAAGDDDIYEDVFKVAEGLYKEYLETGTFTRMSEMSAFW